MQRADTDACFGMTHPATYKDCSSEVALELIMGGFGYQVRIKPSTRTVQYRLYSTKTGVSLWTSLQEFDQKTVESWTTHHGWLEPTRTVEVPV
jgi:spore coat protein U-like protein